MTEAKVKQLLEDFQRKTIAFQERRVEACYSSNSENVNGFTKCILKSIDEMEQMEKKISGLMMFSQLKAEACGKEGKDPEFCLNSAYKYIDQHMNDYSRSLD